MAHLLDNLEWPHPGLCSEMSASMCCIFSLGTYLSCVAVVGRIVWTGRVTSLLCSASIVELPAFSTCPLLMPPTPALRVNHFPHTILQRSRAFPSLNSFLLPFSSLLIPSFFYPFLVCLPAFFTLFPSFPFFFFLKSLCYYFSSTFISFLL